MIGFFVFEIMNKSPAFQWYPKDILASSRVQEMSLAEEGAYRRLLDYCWLNGSVPADERRCARLIGKGATVEIAKVVLDMFETHATDSTIKIHDRLEAEREKQEGNSRVRQAAAEARWNKQGTSADASGKQVKSKTDANAMQTDMQNDALHTSSSSSSSEREELGEEKESEADSKKKAATAKPKADPKIPLPENFPITEEMREWALTKTPGVPIDDVLGEFVIFWNDIASRNNRRTLRGWEQTWRNRMTELQAKTPRVNQNGTHQKNNGNSYQPKPSPATTILNREYYNDPNEQAAGNGRSAG